MDFLIYNLNHYICDLASKRIQKAMVKMWLNQGQKYPCVPRSFQNSTFTFGSSCEPGGSVMRFDPRWRAEGRDEIFDEAFSLTDQIYITEYGSDAKVYQWGKVGFEFNDAAQADYLRQLTERIQNYSVRQRPEIKGIFCWSDLRRQMEWKNGLECRLATIDPIIDENRRMTGWKLTLASQYLADVYGQKEQQIKIAS